VLKRHRARAVTVHLLVNPKRPATVAETRLLHRERFLNAQAAPAHKPDGKPARTETFSQLRKLAIRGEDEIRQIIFPAAVNQLYAPDPVAGNPAGDDRLVQNVNDDLPGHLPARIRKVRHGHRGVRLFDRYQYFLISG